MRPAEHGEARATRGRRTSDEPASEEFRLSVRKLRIALVAPPFLPIPPPGYAGTERVIAMLAQTLHARGHQVTVFCSGDSDLPCDVVPVVPEAIWRRQQGWGLAWVEMAVAR